MRIALDAMGGDAAPGINIDGVIAALAATSDEGRGGDFELVLVGPPEAVPHAMEQAGLSGKRVSFVESDGYVGMAEKPMDALRAKPDASIAVCWKLMAAGEVDAVVSAGNTGAVVAAGLRTKLYLKGVKRPGIAVPLPTATGPCVLMDAGANPDSSAKHLSQYAVMGSLYAKAVFGGPHGGDWRPRVGLLNIGGEVGKGTKTVCEAHDLIEAMADKLPARYVANVEGRELFGGAADVVVCDGFVGNVLLKASEGFAAMMMAKFAEGVLGGLGVPHDKAEDVLAKFSRGYRYNEVGGAPLLGVDGVCMIAHGSSDGTAIKNAILTAVTLHEAGVNAKIVEALA